LSAIFWKKVEKSTGIVFTKLQGLTHQQIEGLKKALKPLEAEYVIPKIPCFSSRSKTSSIQQLKKDKFVQTDSYVVHV